MLRIQGLQTGRGGRTSTALGNQGADVTGRGNIEGRVGNLGIRRYLPQYGTVARSVHTGNEAKLKVHLWMWLDTPYDSATLRAWAKDVDLPADKSVLNPVQIHYTSAPVIEDGVDCPVRQRSGLHLGERDTVLLRIDVEALCWELVDGKEAVTFLVRVKEALEDPARLLFDI